MLIGVDAACLGVTDDRLKTGVFTVVSNVLPELARRESQHRFVLYSFSPLPADILALFPKNVTAKVVAPRLGWMSLSLSAEMVLHPPDMFLGFGQALPLIQPKRSIVFLYDLAFERHPEAYPQSYRKLHHHASRALRRADRVVAISESTKKEAMERYQIGGENVSVMPLGVDASVFQQSQDSTAGLEKKFGIRCPYFLFLGSLKPVKNVPRIIDAFSLFRREQSRPYQLVVAGSDWWLDPRIHELLQQHGLEEEVRVIGYVSREDVAALYTQATALVSPSLWEGFGLPYLEAMACGCPVIGSTAGAGPEVIGDAGMLVDPHDSPAIAAAMKEISSSTELSTSLRKKGEKRAILFTWEASAKKLAEIINTL